MAYSDFNGSELDLTFSILNLINNAFDANENVRQSFFAKDIILIISDFIDADSDRRHRMLDSVYRDLNFKSYMESCGDSNIANALVKVVSDMKNLDDTTLDEIAKNGLSKIVSK